MKIFFLLFVWGPALVGFSLGWLVRHPADWTGPAVIAAVGLILTLITYRWGLRRLSTVAPGTRQLFIGGMVAGALAGLMIFGMQAFGFLG